jgi:1-acyl-sn-glycerol-3-phosphate acyltransferase
LKGPVLITANHPNSFLDAIIIAAVFKRPIHFLARGDAFNKPWHSALLKTLHMFPVYRLSEGKENLGLNATAFENSRKVLSRDGIVLIFIEGICVNKHELQPFKKGAARIAATCWKEGIPLTVLPLGIGYNSLQKMGKSVLIQPGDLMHQNELMPFEEDAKNYVVFNQLLFEKINELIFIPKFKASTSNAKQFLGRIGDALNRPLYTLINGFVRKKTKGTVFYDSVLFGLLFFCYPLYLLSLGFLLSVLGLPLFPVSLILFLHPILAYFATSGKIDTTS